MDPIEVFVRASNQIDSQITEELQTIRTTHSVFLVAEIIVTTLAVVAYAF